LILQTGPSGSRADPVIEFPAHRLAGSRTFEGLELRRLEPRAP
jgi:hypothetical protein